MLQTAKADIEEFQKSLSTENKELIEQAKRKAEEVRREVEERLHLQHEQQAEVQQAGAETLTQTPETVTSPSSTSTELEPTSATTTKKATGVGTVAAQSINTLTDRLDELGGSVLTSTSKYLSALHSAVDSLSHHNTKQAPLPDIEAPIVANPLIRMQYDKRSYLQDPQPVGDYQVFAKQFEQEFATKWEPQVNAIEDDGVLAMYERLVPAQVDEMTFFARYFWLLQKIKAEDERRAHVLAMLQQQQTPGGQKGGTADNDEELNWDIDLSPDDTKQPEPQTETNTETHANTPAAESSQPTANYDSSTAATSTQNITDSTEPISEQLAASAMTPATEAPVGHKAPVEAALATEQQDNKAADIKSPKSDPNSLTSSPVEVSKNETDSDVWEWE